MNPIVKTFQYGNHTVTLETGVMARQATAAVMVSMDDTSVLVSVVGKKEGYVAKHGDNVVIIPEVSKKHVTPYSEAYQAVIWHSIVSHPLLQKNKTKW